MTDVAVMSVGVVQCSRDITRFEGAFEVSQFSVALDQAVICTIPCFYSESKLVLRAEYQSGRLFWQTSETCSFEVTVGELLEEQHAKMRGAEFEVDKSVKPVFMDPSEVPNEFRGFVAPKRCPHCDAWFTKLDLYKRHTATHFGGMAFLCRIADTKTLRPHAPAELGLDRFPEINQFGCVQKTITSTCGRVSIVIEYWIVGYMYMALKLKRPRWNLFHAMVLHGSVDLVQEVEALLKYERENRAAVGALILEQNCDGLRPLDLAMSLTDGHTMARFMYQLTQQHTTIAPTIEHLRFAVMSGTLPSFELARSHVPSFAYDTQLVRKDFKDGLTLLAYACSLGRLTAVKEILRSCNVRRNDISRSNRSNFALFAHLDVEYSTEAILPHHLRQLVGGRTPEGDTLLTLALKGKHDELSRFLLHVLPPSVLDPAAMNEDSMTALMYACEAGNTEAVMFLVRTNYGPLQRPTDGKTILHLAAANLHLEVVRTLVEHHGAWLVAEPDFSGTTARDLVQQAANPAAATRAQLMQLLTLPEQGSITAVAPSARDHVPHDVDHDVDSDDGDCALETKESEQLADTSGSNHADDDQCSSACANDMLPLGSGDGSSIQDIAMAARNATTIEVATLLAIPAPVATAFLDHCGWRAAELVVEHTSDPGASFAKLGATNGAACGFEWERSSSIECPTCYAQVESGEFSQLETCGHALCTECWAMALTVSVQELGPHCLTQRNCPVCNRGAVTPSVWEACAPGQTLRKYEQYAIGHFLRSQDRIVQCPNSRCKKYIFATDTMDACHCECGASFCAKCLRDCHAPLRCDEAESWTSLNQSKADLLSFEHLMTHYKRCPKCRTFIEKNEGCNHMTCRTNGGGCGYEFCWVCGGPHPCRGGCTAVATTRWNATQSVVSDHNASKASIPEHQLSGLWKETFDHTNTYDSQIADLTFIVAELDQTHPVRPLIQNLWQSMHRALECCMEIVRLMKNIEIRCYRLREAWLDKRSHRATRNAVAGREGSLRSLLHGLRQHLDHVIFAMSAFTNFERSKVTQELNTLLKCEEVPTENITFLHVKTAEASNFLQLAMHGVLQEEAVDPAPQVAESKVSIDLDDADMQYLMAKQIVNREPLLA